MDTALAVAAPAKLRVLVVDDFSLNRRILSKQLEVLGYRVDEAQDGIQALAMWYEGDYSVVITDCEMPICDGFDLARSIRAIEARITRRGRTPILGHTAYVVNATPAKCRVAGMDDVLPKPIDLKTLGHKLAWLLRPTMEPKPMGWQEFLNTLPQD